MKLVNPEEFTCPPYQENIIMYSRGSLFLSAVLFVIVFMLFFLVICSLRVLQKCTKCDDEEDYDCSNSKVTDFSEFNSSVRDKDKDMCNINESSILDQTTDGAQMETFPSADPKVDDKILHQNEEFPVLEENKQSNIGIDDGNFGTTVAEAVNTDHVTRDDGSMDTCL